MSKTYGLQFTSEDPRSGIQPSLSPTLVVFAAIDGSVVVTPGITKPIASVGLYTFNYMPTLPVFFLADGGSSLSAENRYLSGILDPLYKTDIQIGELGSTMQAIGSTLNGLGNSNFALGTTNVALGLSNFAFGNTNFAIGTTLTGYAVSLTAESSSIYAGLLGYSSSIQDILARIGQTTSAIGTTSTNPGDLFGYLKRMQEFSEGNQTFNKQSGVWTINTRGNTLLATKTLTNSNTTVSKS